MHLPAEGRTTAKPRNYASPDVGGKHVERQHRYVVPMPLWLHWIVLGLVAGALAKFLMPGRDPAGCLITVALGIVGALLGGCIGSHLGWGA